MCEEETERHHQDGTQLLWTDESKPEIFGSRRTFGGDHEGLQEVEDTYRFGVDFCKFGDLVFIKALLNAENVDRCFSIMQQHLRAV